MSYDVETLLLEYRDAKRRFYEADAEGQPVVLEQMEQISRDIQRIFKIEQDIPS